MPNPFYGAGLVIHNPANGKVLMARRAASSTYPGYWDFPGGGLEAGEGPLDAAIREGIEELGSLPRLKIDINPAWYTPSHDFAFASFLAHLDPSRQIWEPVINQEHDDWGWFSLNRLPDPIIPGPIEAIQKFFGKRSA